VSTNSVLFNAALALRGKPANHALAEANTKTKPVSGNSL
jgi:hypothetical protein